MDRLLTGLQKNLGAVAIDVYDPRFFLKPLFARLRRDEESVNEIFQVLSESSDPVVKTSFPRILAETSGVTPALAQWCLAELRRQLEAFGFHRRGLRGRWIRPTRGCRDSLG